MTAVDLLLRDLESSRTLTVYSHLPNTPHGSTITYLRSTVKALKNPTNIKHKN